MEHREDELTPLAASGVSPWNHRAAVDSRGCLTLVWRTASGSDRIRSFTQEETSALLDILYEAKNDINAHEQISGKAGVCPICLSELDAVYMCPNRSQQDHVPVLRSEFVDGQL